MGCTAPDGSRMGRVGLRDRVRGGAKGPHRAGRRAPASLRPMRQDPSARVGPPPLTVGRRAALHRERKSLPHCRTPHACGWCHRRAGCLRNFNKGHNERNVGMTRRRLACTPRRRLVGGGAERCAPAATAACTLEFVQSIDWGDDVRTAAGTQEVRGQAGVQGIVGAIVGGALPALLSSVGA